MFTEITSFLRRKEFQESLRSIGNMIYKKKFTNVKSHNAIKLESSVFDIFPKNDFRKNICTKMTIELNRYLSRGDHKFLIKERNLKIGRSRYREDIFDELVINNDYLISKSIVCISPTNPEIMFVTQSIYFKDNLKFDSETDENGETFLLLRDEST